MFTRRKHLLKYFWIINSGIFFKEPPTIKRGKNLLKVLSLSYQNLVSVKKERLQYSLQLFEKFQSSRFCDFTYNSVILKCSGSENLRKKTSLVKVIWQKTSMDSMECMRSRKFLHPYSTNCTIVLNPAPITNPPSVSCSLKAFFLQFRNLFRQKAIKLLKKTKNSKLCHQKILIKIDDQLHAVHNKHRWKNTLFQDYVPMTWLDYHSEPCFQRDNKNDMVAMCTHKMQQPTLVCYFWTFPSVRHQSAVKPVERASRNILFD